MTKETMFDQTQGHAVVYPVNLSSHVYCIPTMKPG